jgi:hypothetical protein
MLSHSSLNSIQVLIKDTPGLGESRDQPEPEYLLERVFEGSGSSDHGLRFAQRRMVGVHSAENALMNKVRIL